MKKQSVAIVGAGISGLALGRLLDKELFNVRIFEGESAPGGIARTRNFDGVPFHKVGGHCFNSKNPAVLDFVFSQVLPEDQWHKVARDARIHFRGHVISYPIEFAVRDIFRFDADLAVQIVDDFLLAREGKAENLEEWFLQKFGKALAEAYFIPYNRKIWGMEPGQMSHRWVEGKLPQPDKQAFIRGLFQDASDSMPHSTFYYPNSNDQSTFIESLSRGLDISYGCEIHSLVKGVNRWILNGEVEADIVINTGPLDKVPALLKSCPDQLVSSCSKLKYNKLTTMLWKAREVDATWTYFPGSDSLFHRHIHIGNFLTPRRGEYTITESIGEHSFDTMLEHGRRIDYLLEPIDYHVSDYAYPVFDNDYSSATRMALDCLDELGLYQLGRFAEWQYYNMDVCIEKAMELSAALELRYGQD